MAWRNLIGSALRRHPRAMLADSLCWAAALTAALWARLDFGDVRAWLPGLATVVAMALAAQLAVGIAHGPYGKNHRSGSVEEALDVAGTVVIVGLTVSLLVSLQSPPMVPRGVPIVATPIVVTLALGLRIAGRVSHTRLAAKNSTGRRAIVYGAGDGARLLLRSIALNPASSITPVALVDDDRAKQRLRVEGVPVRGTRDSIVRLAAELGADLLVVAIPSADGALLRAASQVAEDAGLEVLSLPSLSKLVGRVPTVGDLDRLDLADLLGRRPVVLDRERIDHSLSGRTVLVTGAGGSIGSELCRQVAKFGPARLFLLDRDESGLHATHLSLYGNGLLDDDSIVLANIRDPLALRRAFERTRPEIVFHAAALKHLPILETHAIEAWETNVLGTLNVLEAAAVAGVKTFVNISTDKAANPTSVLGYSKRLGERLTAEFAQAGHGRYVSVRFGNVLGSRGSVLHSFMSQIEHGGPITVTHPDVERFFMLIPEASQLVLQAATMGEGGEVMVLEMGDQIRIVDVARTLARRHSSKPIDIWYTGLRPGEKLREELFDDSETPEATDHPLVHQVVAERMDLDGVRDIAFTTDADARTWMATVARNELGLRHG